VKLAEAFRRRRAAGGPAESTFAALVGLELRPRRLREAAALWTALTEHRGVPGRDALWGHPDLLPSDDDFADPVAYAQSQLDLGMLEGFDDLAKPASDNPEPGSADLAKHGLGEPDTGSADLDKHGLGEPDTGSVGLDKPELGEAEVDKPEPGKDDDEGSQPAS
jgi:hypothetical protein